jgi:O-antigen/teichoic acid export membrane protein
VTDSRPDDEHSASRARIERRFRVNSTLIIAARVVTACLSLLVIPVLVSRFGVAGYGTWEALLALATLTSLFQTAISGALVWNVSEAFGRGDNDLIRRLARVGAGASWTLFVLLWPLAWLLREPVVEFLRIPLETRGVAAQIFPIVAATVLLSGLCQTLEAIVSGCQRTGVVNVIAAIGQISNYAVVLGVIFLGGGLSSLAAGQIVGFLVRLGCSWFAARAAFGPVSLIPLVPGRRDWALARYSGLLTVGAIAAALREQTDKVILSSLASPAWVGYYGMAVRLSSLVMETISFFYVPMLTAVGALNALGDWQGVRRLYSRLMATVSTVTGLVLIVVAGLADQLVTLWLGYPIPEVTSLLWLLIAGTASAAILTGPGTAICRGCDRVGIETTYLTFNLVLNLVLTISLVLLIGPIGTAVATGSTWAVSSILFLIVLHRRLDLPADASQRAAATALLAAVIAGAAYWLSHLSGLPRARYDAFISLVLFGSVCGTAYLGLLVAFRLVSIDDAYGGFRSWLRRA